MPSWTEVPASEAFLSNRRFLRLGHSQYQAVNVIESIRDVLSRLSRSLVPTSHQVLRDIARVRQNHH